MAIDNETMNGTPFTMPVQPMYGGYGNNNGGFGFGGDGLWFLILFFLLAGNGGWGNGFGGGMWGGDGLYPWMNNSNQINGGFRDQMINDNVTSIRDGIHGLSTQLCNCCGDMQNTVNQGFNSVQTSLCNGFAGVNAGVANGFAQAEIANNARQIADMQQNFAAQTAVLQGFNGVQTQLATCCCDNKAGLADLKYTVATENCADRTAAYQNTRDIIDSQTRGTQAILDKLCQLELDGYKQQVEAKNDQIGQLRSQLQYANMQASQVDQTAQLRTIAATTANQAITELRSCPIPAQPVYGNTPIFTCGGTTIGCGCGAVA